ncbi:hypothetical protein BGX28_001921, partial [Mortierella sp. GBA30]
MIKDMEQPITTVELLGPSEQDVLLRLWNKTDMPFPEDRCIHELFEVKATETPDAIALIHADDSMTYGDLNIRANVLARQLLELGVRHKDFVALWLPRSFELVICQLALLKIGAAYVPIDPKAPVDRQTFIVKDSSSRLLITDALTYIPSALDIPLLRFSIDMKQDAEIANIDVTGSSLDNAYVMYTSGSTGLPKG